MGILIISGSPREKGNTELLLSILNEELISKSIETEYITLSGKKINHCVHCDKCRGINRCIQGDDFNSIYERVLENRGLVVGSPVYVGAPTSLLMAFIQRTSYISYNNKGTLARKIGGPIAVAGEAGQLTTINCLIDFYLVNNMFIPSSNYWNIGVGFNKGNILEDKKGHSYIKRFADNLAYMMEKL